MKELLQRLGALDEDAMADVKIIMYFDTLLAQRAGMEAFVRGASVLSGWPAGLAHPRQRIWLRVDVEGRSTQTARNLEDCKKWPHHELGDDTDALVWIERPTGPSSHDAMLLERMATAIRLTLERVSPLGIEDDAGAVEILLSTTSTNDARRKASNRLHLRDNMALRIVANSPTTSEPIRRSAVMGSSIGPIRAAIVEQDEVVGSGGVGSTVTITDLPQSWAQAVDAFRLTSRLTPVVRWDEWGVLTAIAAAADDTHRQHPDVVHVELAAKQEPWAIDTMYALVLSDSNRAAATLLGLHHSTVQARQAQLQELLGFDITAAIGRIRLTLALAIYQFHTLKLAGSD